ncbi:hypothetical protein LCGC14_1639730 [marine sediment metagenome]|uniref:Transglycosylase SLT domain-containing protein n=1 Tax=marine sediment metagenome TaxID=412755 RepID=A0A0F9HZY1_9ZZZZ
MGINTMTIDNLKIFSKIAAQDNLASTLALKYNRATANIQRKFGVSPRRSSYGPTKLPITSGGTTYNRYLNSIMQQESAGKFNVVNKQSGALGLYQFMPKTLRGLGYKGTSQQFLGNPSLQKSYMHKFTKQNAKSLGINMQTMTSRQAGLLAAAHYGGVGGAKKIMGGNRRYGTTSFQGKTPYAYMNDVLRRMYAR